MRKASHITVIRYFSYLFKYVHLKLFFMLKSYSLSSVALLSECAPIKIWKKHLPVLLLTLFSTFTSIGQIGQEFWFAVPEVTESHNTVNLRSRFIVSTFDSAATVRIYQPASLSATRLDTTFTVAANTSQFIELDTGYSSDPVHYPDELENRPEDSVLAKGVLIESDADITAYYEVRTTNNPDLFALKADNGLGTEFYIPFQTLWPNQVFGGGGQTRAYSAFDIVATEDNTTIYIFPSEDLYDKDGGVHPAGVPYLITLNRGETYTGRANSEAAADHPSGTVVSSDKPIAITYSDDSVRASGFGCYDLYGDQLVPTSIIGTDYILNSNNGSFNPPELAVIVATENFTTLNRDGAFETVLFAGQTYIDTITTNSVYYNADKPFYLIQITGFGCEMGSAILPPLNCAGSSQVSFARSTTEGFFLSLLVRSGSEGDFELDGDNTLIQASDFAFVPGTSNEWMAAFIQYNTTEVSAGNAHLVTNSSDVFSLGVINGGSSSGTRFGYFSKFAADINTDAGPDISTCSGNDVPMNGSVTGGVTTGRWFTTNGSGTFDDDTDFNAIYDPTTSDYALGTITVVLESTGNCFAVYDTMQITFTPSPTIDAGVDQTICKNNAAISLGATITVAAGVVWNAENGTSFSPDSTSLNTVYTPTAAQLTAGSMQIYAYTTAAGDCATEYDTLDITFRNAPIVEAGGPYTSCANNPDVNLAGSVTIYSGFGTGEWLNGNGGYNPGNTALGATYTPTAPEISSSPFQLTLRSTNSTICLEEDDIATVTVDPSPTVNAGPDQSVCSNNAAITLAGSFTLAPGATWSGGTTSGFNPSRTDPTAIYTPTQAEINAGSLTLTLTTDTYNSCLGESDDVTITFTASPTSDAGVDQSICANNASVALSGSTTVGTGVQWSGGTASGFANDNAINTTYTATASEITAGTVRLYLTTTGSANNCIEATDSIDITIEPSPVVEAGGPYTSCGNNPTVSLAGSVTNHLGFGSGSWSGGTGSGYSPGTTALNANYTPTAAEINNGSVSITLTSTSNPLNCNAVADNATITIATSPTVNAGPDQSVCSNNAATTLNASFTGAASGEWSGGSGTFTPDEFTANAIYTPTQPEINAGSLTLTFTTDAFGSCLSTSDDMEITFTASPTSDAGLDQSICANNASVSLSGSTTVGTGVQWSGGTASGFGNDNAINTSYSASASEITAGTVRLYLTTTGSANNCIEATDSIDITIEPSPVVDANGPYTSCGNNPTVALAGSVTNHLGFGTGNWSGGTGSGYSPGTTALNASYTPTATEINNGSVNITLTSTSNPLNCIAVSDNATITIATSPTVNAGPDQSVCSNNAATTLDASFTGAVSGEWSGGAGSFSPDEFTANAVYTPTQAEINAGSLTLTFTTDAYASCLSTSDDMEITFTASPTSDAGVDQSVCANNASVSISGSTTIGTGVQWSGGTPSGFGNANAATTTYTPTAAEITAGTVRLYLTTTGSANNCIEAVDSLDITIQPSPVVDAGGPYASCGNNPSVTLSGSVTNHLGFGTGTWSGGTGSGYNPGATALNAQYTPTASEINNGTVNLTLTSTSNPLNCLAENDAATITIETAPTVNAGVDQSICSNNAVTTLNATFTGASSGEWTGGGGSFSPNEFTANATYTPTQAEINAGSLTLTFTTDTYSTCLSTSDDMVITFTPSPTADAGIDQSVCANNEVVTLSGGVTVASGGQWSGGTGSGFGNINSLNTTYTPSAAEITAGTVRLYLTTTGSAGCTEVIDSMDVTITAAPIVSTGGPYTSCGNDPDVNLAGSVITSQGLGSGQWSVATGSYNPNNIALNAIYTPTPTEINNGTISNFTLTSTGSTTGCNEVADQTTITISPSPTSNAGPDQIVCANNSTVQLAGVATNQTQTEWQGGFGLFSPSRNDLNAEYTPTQAEINLGFIDLRLVVTGAPDCIDAEDDIRVSFSPGPTVDAGPAQSVCANNEDVTLNGSFTVSPGAEWSNYTGTWVTGDEFTTNSTYKPSATEITAGSVTLRLTTINNGDCNAVTDSVIITIDPSPIVSAGIDDTSCTNNASVVLAGTVSNAGGIEWTGNGSFVPNVFDPNATYSPTQAEINAGIANISIQSTANPSNCIAATDNKTIVIGPEPTVSASIDQTLCENNPIATMNGSQSGAQGLEWITGFGGYSDINSGTTTYTPTQTEINSGSVDLVIRTTGNGKCAAETDTMTINFTPAPTVDAGSNQSVCANNQQTTLNGSITVATGGLWSGDGSFDNSSSLSAIYTPTNSEITAGQAVVYLVSTGNGNCTAVNDSMIITITAAPIVDAGATLSSCANNPSVNLQGTMSGAGGVEWTNGTGSFNPNVFDRNAQYIPSSAEISSGLVTLILNSTANGNCNAVSDFVQITINSSPTVDAGIDQTLCGNNSDASLSGSVTLATGVMWSGNGLFSPSDTALNPTYTPTAQETNTGTATITLTSTGNGNCIAATDNMTLTFTASPIASAGLDKSVCSNNAATTLDGSVSIATGGTWIGGTGSFNPNANTLNAVYTPSATEISSGSLQLTLLTTGNGQCTQERDSLTITFTPAPFANAGADQTVCVDELDVQLTGIVSGANTTGTWSTSGTGFFVPNQNDLNAVYRSSTQDSTNGGATITLTTTNHPTCLAESDDMQIVITTAGVANAGVDQSVCANNSTITLNGNVQGGALSGIWSTTGSGTFNPDNSTLNAVYSPSAQDTANGGATFTLTANSCNLAQDQMSLTITPRPQVSAGSDQLVCVDDLDIQLDGSVFGASTTGQWTTPNGTGSFNPSSSSLNAVYEASSQDSLSGNVTLILTATSIGTCNAANDTVLINILPGGTVSAGSDQSVCANNPAVSLNGSIGGGALGGTWSSSGSGSFTPNNTTLNATYTPSNTDINNGSVTLTLTANSCDNVTDDLVVTITPAPTVDAGSDIDVCDNNSDAPLSGTITVATGGSWTTTGAGTFSPSSNVLNATYQPDASDQNIQLFLTTTNNGNCNAVVDSLILTQITAPIVDAGLDVNICAGTQRVPLSGSVSNGTTTGNWTTLGSGGFDPSSVVLGSDYILSSADSTAGTVTLVLTSTGSTLCNAVTDTMVINVTEVGNVSAGVDQSICANNAFVTLDGSANGNITVATWTTSGDGSFSPNNLDTNATYIPGSADSTAGTVTLTLAGNSCNAPSDNMVVTITDAPFVQAGPNQTNCVNDLDFALDGIVAGASNTGLWSSTGTGNFIPNASTLNATYQASSNDSIAGSVILTLSASNIGNCSAVSDQLELRMTTGGTASAGNDQVVCKNNPSVQLNGTFTGGATNGTWSTSGTGSFSPTVTTANAVYSPSSFDLSSGNVTITYTANSCDQPSDDLNVTFTDSPVAEAGGNQTICSNSPNVALTGSISVATGGIWESNGTGTFNPSNTDTNAVYSPSTDDITAGSVRLKLTTTGNGNCLSVSDSLNVNFSGAPNVQAGDDQIICKGTSNTVLQGFVTVGASSGRWTTLGSGAFSPHDSTLFLQYTFSEQDTTDGSVEIILTSTNNGNCNAVSDTLEIVFSDQGTANAGPDLAVCENNISVQLDGTLSGGATQALWSTGGDGSFIPNNTTIDPIYQMGSADSTNGQVTLTLSTNSCNQASDIMNVTITPAPTVDAGADQVNCVNDLDFDLDGVVTGTSGSGLWSTNGTGTFAPDENTLSATYNASANDSIAGDIQLVLEATNIGNCAAVSDTIDLRITTGGSASAGNDQVLCKNNAEVQLNGSFSGGANKGTWSTSGTGSFSPNITTANAIYTPSSFDLSNGNALITYTANSCDQASDNLIVTFTESPSADAGINQTICNNNTDVQLDGTITVASGGLWVSSGTGTFSPSNSTLNAIYAPSQADLDSGSIKMALISTGNGNCLSAADSMAINFSGAPEVNAGADQSICKGTTTATLQGFVGVGSSTGRWTTAGSGIFQPHDSTLFAQYEFSTQDTLDGSVEIYLTSTNNGTCNSVMDTMLITFADQGSVNAGTDQIVCANNMSAQLDGSLTGGAVSAIWSTSGDGSFVPNNTEIDPIYIPGSADSLNGFVTLTLSGNSCNQASDQVNITITPAPTVNAGPNQVNCVNDLEFDLDGTVTGTGGSGLWSTSGTGTFSPDASTLNATYTASSNDSIAGDVQLILEATNAGNCLTVQDTLILRITTGGTASAGNDQSVCDNNADIQLNGSFTGGASSGTWSTSGTGSFSPDNATMNAVYSPSDFDLASGTVNITLTTNSCNLASDALIVTFTGGPSAEAGDNASVCANNTSITLNGTITVASGGIWTSSGSGSFTPSNTNLNATYTPSQAEIDSGSVVIYLETTGNGTCLSSIDSLIASITASPIVNAGSNQQVCISSGSTTLNGSVISNASQGRWTTLGNGTFFPNDSTLNAQYSYGSQDTSNGSVLMILTSINNNTCLAEDDTMEISFGDSPFVLAGPDEFVCSDNMVAELNGFVTGGATTGSWSSPTGTGTFSPDNTSLSTTYTLSTADSTLGLVKLVLTSTNNGGCIAGRDTMEVSLAPTPVIDAGVSRVLCLNADTVELAPDVTNTSSITWRTLGTGTFAPSVNTEDAIYTFSETDRSLGGVDLIISTTGDFACFTVEDTVTIALNNPLSPDFRFGGLCLGGEVTFIDSTKISNGSIATWAWNFGDGESSDAQNPKHEYATVGTYDVELILASNNGCFDSLTQSLTINPQPIAGFTSFSESYQVFTPVNFIDQSSGANSYEYIFGAGLDTSRDANPSFTYTSSGLYIATQIVTTNAGCSDSASVELTIISDDIYPPVMPTAFTPNNDGENDTLFIRGGPFSETELTVYNEWGEEIFRSTDASIGWDGTHDGKDQPVGSFVYTVKAITVDNKVYTLTGDITLIR